jgi:hypothetical protein
MSGHHATLLRGTVEALLPHHDVYITDWLDARNVPAAAGRFDLDDYIGTLISIFRYFGGDVHVMAVCQPSVPVLAATALLEAAGSGAVPRSLILVGGPVDTRISETAVNRLAIDRGTEWFRRHVITTVPWPLPGHGRAVYPGFLQLSGFIGMNFGRHANAHRDMFLHLVCGDGDSAARHRAFYDEYLAVMDLGPNHLRERRAAKHKSDHRKAVRSLCSRRDHTRCGHAAKKRNELPPLHANYSTVAEQRPYDIISRCMGRPRVLRRNARLQPRSPLGLGRVNGMLRRRRMRFSHRSRRASSREPRPVVAQARKRANTEIPAPLPRGVRLSIHGIICRRTWRPDGLVE